MAIEQQPQPTRRAVPVINITPIVDVLLILLVVLLLAMPLTVQRLPVDMPQVSLTGEPVPVQSLVVGVGPGGQLFLERTAAPMESVKRRITNQTSVELAVDAKVSYEDLAKVVASLQEASPKEIVLLTR
jgi:biopolymer transport protein TolR